VFNKPIYGTPPTPEQWKGMLETLETSVARLQDLKKKGKVECYYGLSGIRGGFGIIDVESHEELDELITNLPVSALGQIEVHPIISLESKLETFKKSMTQMRRKGYPAKNVILPLIFD
jgi:muconolactone delta-isomerase